MPYTTTEYDGDVEHPYTWDSPEAAWDGLVAGQSADEFLTAGAPDSYAADIVQTMLDYLDFYRMQDAEMLAGMTDAERDDAAALMARYALANASPETLAQRGY